MRRDDDAAQLLHAVHDLAHRPRRRSEDLGRMGKAPRIGEVAEVVAPVRDELDATQGEEALVPPGRPDLVETLERVRVREDDAVEPHLAGPADHIARGQAAALRVVAVDVDVDEHGAAINTARARRKAGRVKPERACDVLSPPRRRG